MNVNAPNCLFFLFALLGLAQPGFSIVTYQKTKLPFPETNQIAQSDGYMLGEVAALDVFADSEDANQFYYLPEFHVRQYSRGAGSLMPNAHVIKQYAAAKTDIDLRNQKAEEYTLLITDKIDARIVSARDEVLDAESRLEDAMVIGNVDLIALRKRSLERAEKELTKSEQELFDAKETIKSKGSLWPAGMKKMYNERIVMHVAFAGISIPYDHIVDPDVMFERIKESVDDFSNAYGGFMSLNVYAGFSAAQLRALRDYKTKFFPHIKVALLPVEKLTFFPLTEMYLDKKADESKPATTTLFRQIKGAGDYLGTAIVLDTTVAGALGMAEHLAPFILPLGIKATYKQKAIPTEAELHCDFSNGYSVKGRADIRDGLVIYDNDKTDNIKAYDDNKSACYLTNISGNVESAQFKALDELKNHFAAMYLHRTNLSKKEKQAYYESVQADIESNRREEEPKYTQIIKQFSGTTWETLVIEGLTRAADFHWHTNIQDVENLSRINFHEKISINGFEKIESEIATNLCLVFNSQLMGYDRCTTEEEGEAKNMGESMAEAASSPECQNNTDPFNCGKSRDKAGKTPRRGYIEADDALLITKF